MFYYTIVNIDCDYEPLYWTKISTSQLIHNIIQNYLTDEVTTTKNLQVLTIRLMYENTKLHSMIDSEDDDVSQLAIQMLFNNYLDLYNKLDETGCYIYTLHEYPKFLTYYEDRWYEKYCHRY